MTMATDPPNRRALLSVSDKTGIVELARALSDRGFQIVSTGGTARALREAGLAVTEVAELTGHPEIMGGRVKTLHPAIHGGLLARREVPGDLEALADHGYRPIDLVAVNLYPFRETIARGGVPVAEAMEQVDIGGPTMIRAAAKNHAHVWVVVDPADYGRVLRALDAGEGEAGGGDGNEAALRRDLAAKVFRHISGYDEAVAEYLERPAEAAAEAAPGGGTGSGGDTPNPGSGDASPHLPGLLTGRWTRQSSLRYGENPDQAAALYRPEGAPAVGIAALEQHHGKALSYNNLLDLDGVLLSLSPFARSPRAAVCIVKHTTPSGLAVGDSVEEAYRKALACDPVSAFGSVIAANRPVDAPAARAISELFVECLVAPFVSDEAMEVLTGKKNLRILTFPGDSESFLADYGRVPDPVVLRGIYGGLLAQTAPVPPFYGVDDPEWRVVTRRAPGEAEMDDLAFAWAAAFGVKSNAIVLAGGGATLGIGAGQTSRVDSSRLAVRKAAEAGLSIEGCALASDAFFPFRDGVDAAADAGVRAIIQPGGSVRDEEVIEAADGHGIAMVFTGRRLFRH
jgi:phosphoribosylaminoimidazolecarboxamide formyltransferase / IMP cyclohydrolase